MCCSRKDKQPPRWSAQDYAPSGSQSPWENSPPHQPIQQEMKTIAGSSQFPEVVPLESVDSSPIAYQPPINRDAPELLPPSTPSSYQSSPSTYHPTPSTTSAASTAVRSTASTPFASLSLHHTDRIRLLSFPPSILPVLLTAIHSTWAPGLVRPPYAHPTHSAATEIHLAGTPWLAQGPGATGTRRLLRAILAALHGEGWVLSTAASVGKKPGDKDVMLFRQQTPAPRKAEWMSVYLSWHDRVRFVDASEGLVEAAVRVSESVLVSHGPKKGEEGVYELRFAGSPWTTGGEDGVDAQMIVLRLVGELDAWGWTVYASVNQKQGRNGWAKGDTWHCCRAVDWDPSLPVYHR